MLAESVSGIIAVSLRTFCYINHHVRFIKRNCNHLISIYKNIQLTLVFNLPRKLTVILKIIYQLKQQLIQL